MVTKQQRMIMRDYLVSKLELCNKEITPMSREVVSGIVSNYIIVKGENLGVILLVDQIYPRDSFAELYGDFELRSPAVLGVVFKDGKTFFRNAAERHYFKKEKGLSLKNYTSDEMRRMILFRPEEIFLSTRRKWLEYFQPASAQLREGIESFEFEPVVFDYSHIDPSERFKPQNRDSERLHIWKKREHVEGDLRIKKGYLTDMPF